jgi:hypothetical protein
VNTGLSIRVHSVVPKLRGIEEEWGGSNPHLAYKGLNPLQLGWELEEPNEALDGSSFNPQQPNKADGVHSPGDPEKVDIILRGVKPWTQTKFIQI